MSESGITFRPEPTPPAVPIKEKRLYVSMEGDLSVVDEEGVVQKVALGGSGSGSPRVFYASQHGCALNSNIDTGGGTDDTAALQAILDSIHTAGGGTLIIDGVGLVSATLFNATTHFPALQVYSNTRIEFTKGAGLFLAAHSNVPIIAGGYGYALANVEIVGGTLNCNAANQDKQDSVKWWPYGVSFYNFTNVTLRDVLLRNPKTFGYVFSAGLIQAGKGVRMYNCAMICDDGDASGTSNKDGIHLWGTLDDIIVDGFIGEGDDDTIALNTDEGVKGYQVNTFGTFIFGPSSGGDITNALFRNIHIVGSNHGQHPYRGCFYGVGSGQCKNIRFENWYSYGSPSDSGFSVQSLDLFAVNGWNLPNNTVLGNATILDLSNIHPSAPVTATGVYEIGDFFSDPSKSLLTEFAITSSARITPTDTVLVALSKLQAQIAGGGIDSFSNGTPPVLTGTAAVGDALTSSNGIWAGSPTSFTYQWQRSDDGSTGWIDLSGATTNSYTPVSGDLGKFLRCTVTASASSISLFSSSTPQVVNAALANTAPPSLTGTAIVGEVLTSSDGDWIGSPTSFTYQWQRYDGVFSWNNISGATSNSRTLVLGDVGAVRCNVTAHTSLHSASAASDQLSVVAVVNTTPPSLTGTAIVGEVLTSSDGDWIGSPTSFTYQWQRSDDGSTGWIDLSGATTNSYTSTVSESGKYLRCKVTAFDALMNSGFAFSASSDQVPAGYIPISVLSDVQIDLGGDFAGEPINSALATWNGTPTIITYQWQVSDDNSSWSDIAGATSTPYSSDSSQSGKYLRVVVTAGDGTTSASSTSNSTQLL